MNITEKELDVLQAIKNSNFSDGDRLNCWSSCIHEKTKIVKGKAIAGIVASLKKKELITIEDENTSDACCYITIKGKEILGV